MRRTARRQEAFDRARALGVTIEETVRKIILHAPEGCMITAASAHGVVCVWDPSRCESKAGAWARVLHDLSEGVSLCPAGRNCYCQKEPT